LRLAVIIMPSRVAASFWLGRCASNRSIRRQKVAQIGKTFDLDQYDPFTGTAPFELMGK
jgi:hypothetical protein